MYARLKHIVVVVFICRLQFNFFLPIPIPIPALLDQYSIQFSTSCHVEKAVVVLATTLRGTITIPPEAPIHRPGIRTTTATPTGRTTTRTTMAPRTTRRPVGRVLTRPRPKSEQRRLWVARCAASTRLDVL